MTTFAQLSARLKNFLRGWLLVLGLKEGLVECATVCVKSVVILKILSYKLQQPPRRWSRPHESTPIMANAQRKIKIKLVGHGYHTVLTLV